MREERVKELIEKYKLQPHPEGGFYSETYRSSDMVETKNGRRNLMTVIYFLLTSADISRFHVIESDELWFHHEGSDLTIHILKASGYEKKLLGKSHCSAQPQHMVQKRNIFGSTLDTPGSYALVSCVVAPGFDFNDFKLVSKKELLEKYPDYCEIIERLGHW